MGRGGSTSIEPWVYRRTEFSCSIVISYKYALDSKKGRKEKEREKRRN